MTIESDAVKLVAGIDAALAARTAPKSCRN